MAMAARELLNLGRRRAAALERSLAKAVLGCECTDPLGSWILQDDALVRHGLRALAVELIYLALVRVDQDDLALVRGQNDLSLVRGQNDLAFVRG